MTLKTKLEIIGEYRKDHPGPFCTRDGSPVDLRITDGRGLYPLAGYIGDNESLVGWKESGRYECSQREEDRFDLMCAREVPVAFECWVIVGEGKPVQMRAYPSAEVANMMQTEVDGMKRLIHMREVLPGEGA